MSEPGASILRTEQPIKIDASDLHDVKIVETPDGEGFRRLLFTWKDNRGGPQSHGVFGYDAEKVHADLATLRAHGSDERVAAYVLGFVRARS